MIQPPPLRNDCFAMPQGVDWMPVDTALARLREALHTITPVETVPTLQAAGRVLAVGVMAQRAGHRGASDDDRFGGPTTGNAVRAGKRDIACLVATKCQLTEHEPGDVSGTEIALEMEKQC